MTTSFTGLDTVRALGVVIISLSLLFEDALLAVFGVCVGAIGVALIVILGRYALSLFY